MLYYSLHTFVLKNRHLTDCQPLSTKISHPTIVNIGNSHHFYWCIKTRVVHNLLVLCHCDAYRSSHYYMKQCNCGTSAWPQNVPCLIHEFLSKTFKTFEQHDWSSFWCDYSAILFLCQIWGQNCCSHSIMSTGVYSFVSTSKNDTSIPIMQENKKLA